MAEFENTKNSLDDMNRWFEKLAGPGSKTAIGVLLARFAESRKPENERICYDPYAIHFVSKDMLEWGAHNPEKMKAIREQHERLFPGLDNSLVARVRFFDDFVKRSIDNGLQQIVIIGAGYDSRAYRIHGLRSLAVFEVDHPATQTVKKEKIKEISGSLPDHVIYIYRRTLKRMISARGCWKEDMIDPKKPYSSWKDFWHILLHRWLTGSSLSSPRTREKAAASSLTTIPSL